MTTLGAPATSLSLKSRPISRAAPMVEKKRGNIWLNPGFMSSSPRVLWCPSTWTVFCQRSPASTRDEAALAATAPGKCSRLFCKSKKKRRDRSGVYLCNEGSIENDSRWLVSMPVSTVNNRNRLRANNPAPTSNRIESATCPATSSLLNFVWPTPSESVPDSLFRVDATFGRDAWSAGSSPKIIAVSRLSPAWTQRCAS